MADINRVVLVGRLTRDAELKYITSGQAISKFAIAVNRRRKDGDQWVDEANFFDITVWGRTAESLNQYLTKGKTVGVEGELRQDRWQQDGQNRSRIEIVASNIMLLGGGPGGASQGGGSSGSSYANNQGGSGSRNEAPDEDDSFSDDIPF
ncbi:MAG: single-stranded DNA-binding protein [Treponema sp.]|nr:single-stranded DNA-binding protein [Treponema sp.]